MRLSVTSGKLDIQPQSISCHLHDGINIVPCTIPTEVLMDLAAHNSLSWCTNLESFGLLIPEIERLANAKYRFRRLDENGELVLNRSDLLRYGFSRQLKSEVDEPSYAWQIAAE